MMVVGKLLLLLAYIAYATETGATSTTNLRSVNGGSSRVLHDDTPVCVNRTTYWETLFVSESEAESLIEEGAKDGICKEHCKSICNHQPCVDDYVVFKFRTKPGVCKCRATPKPKCSTVNTRCNIINDSCQCQPGYAGNASDPIGCPNIGFSLPDLPYENRALEPYIDEKTMKIHHDRHHQTSIDNLNKAVNGTAEAAVPVIELVQTAITSNRTVIRNNAGGHYNHAFFWRILANANVSATMKPSEQLQTLINNAYTNTSNMIALFNAAGTPSALFGSGWVWINVNNNFDGIIISTTPNQDNPLMYTSTNTLYPIIGIDVWEHAYYLKYKNLRNDYVKNFWNIINWDIVSENCAYIIENKKGVSV